MRGRFTAYGGFQSFAFVHTVLLRGDVERRCQKYVAGVRVDLLDECPFITVSQQPQTSFKTTGTPMNEKLKDPRKVYQI